MATLEGWDSEDSRVDMAHGVRGWREISVTPPGSCSPSFELVNKIVTVIVIVVVRGQWSIQ